MGVHAYVHVTIHLHVFPGVIFFRYIVQEKQVHNVHVISLIRISIKFCPVWLSYFPIMFKNYMMSFHFRDHKTNCVV